MVITRTGGAIGRASVDYVFAPTFYTNYLTINFVETNIYDQDFDTNGMSLGFTNIDLLYTNTFHFDQDNEWGEWVYLPVDVIVTNINFTNFNGNISGRTIITNMGTNLPNPLCAGGVSIHITNMTATNFSYTNIVCTNWVVTNLVPTAIAGIDYDPTFASGSALFDDYQMSSDLSFFILPRVGPHHVNRVLIGALSNPQLDPLEANTISPPTAITALTNTIVNILDQANSGPDPHVDSPFVPLPPFIRSTGGTALGFPGTNVFNFTTATIACTESVNGANVAEIRVHRSTVQGPPTGSSVDYRIDFYDHNGAQVPNANNQFRSSGPSHLVPFGAEIPLQAGSDYATPTNPVYFSQQFDGTNPVTQLPRQEPDFIPVTGTLTWGANDGQDKIISVVISNDTRVEFNEDLLLQLYFNGSDPGNPPA